MTKGNHVAAYCRIKWMHIKWMEKKSLPDAHLINFYPKVSVQCTFNPTTLCNRYYISNWLVTLCVHISIDQTFTYFMFEFISYIFIMYYLGIRKDANAWQVIDGWEFCTRHALNLVDKIRYNLMHLKNECSRPWNK